MWLEQKGRVVDGLGRRSLSDALGKVRSLACSLGAMSENSIL